MNDNYPIDTKNDATQPSPFQDAFMTDVASGRPPEQPRAPRRRWLVAVLIIASLLVVIAGVAVLIWYASQPKSCFDTSNYTDLVSVARDFEGGETADVTDVSKNQALFTQPIYFKDASGEINTEISYDTEDLFQKLGTYYKAHRSDAPINVTLRTEYLLGVSTEVADQRIQTIKNKLVQSGVAESSISIQGPDAITMNEDSLNDDDTVDGLPVTIAVSPISLCKE